MPVKEKCQYCGGVHPSHLHVVQALKGRGREFNEIELSLTLPTREWFAVSVALKMARSMAEDIDNDPELAQVFRQTEKNLAAATRRATRGEDNAG